MGTSALDILNIKQGPILSVEVLLPLHCRCNESLYLISLKKIAEVNLKKIAKDDFAAYIAEQSYSSFLNQ